jgi:hypothetical protein
MPDTISPPAKASRTSKKPASCGPRILPSQTASPECSPPPRGRGLRYGPPALKLATAASQAAGGNPVILRTPAAAYAQIGDFSSAVKTARRALDLANAQSNSVLTAALAREIKLYTASQPYQEIR